MAKSRNKELESVRTLNPSFSCQGDVGTFIGLYLQTEVFAKKIQRYYRTDTNKSSEDKLNIAALKAALNHFELVYDNADLPDLFKGGAGKKNEKSARQLRNGYLYSLSNSDKQEIQKKYSKFNSKLRGFLNIRVSET